MGFQYEFKHDKISKIKYLNIKNAHIYIYFKIKYVEIWKNNEYKINCSQFLLWKILLFEKISKLTGRYIIILHFDNRSKSRRIKRTEEDRISRFKRRRGRRKGGPLWDGKISPLPKRWLEIRTKAIGGCRVKHQFFPARFTAEEQR